MTLEAGQSAAIWFARAAAGFYALAIGAILTKRSARGLWTAGLGLYLAHVAFAFTFFYGWSHAVALRETARLTRDLFGVDWGGGLYLNYLFTLVWTADCAWWWLSPKTYASRSRAAGAAIHLFLAFMQVNASLVVWLIRALR